MASKTSASISDLIREVGTAAADGETDLDLTVRGFKVLAKLKAHQQKMGLPVNATVSGVNTHITATVPQQVGAGFAQLQRLCLMGLLP